MSASWDLRILPLGGLGQVGGNLMVYETATDLVVVDCGVLFPTAEQPGIDYVIPDVSYVAARRDKLRAIIVTHGHEDHVGALPYLLPTIGAPIYASPLTLALVRQKLAEHPALNAELHPLPDRQPVTLGGFTVESIAVTHSIPGAVALALRTPVGTVIHSGDFKLDPDPLDGRVTDADAFRRFGEQGVTALLSDSTNAEKPGHTYSERQVAETLVALIGQARGRVLVTAFASNLHRMQSVLRAAEAAGRRVVPIGRAMSQNLHLGLEQGAIAARAATVAPPEELDRLRPEKSVLLVSGSQGEPHSALARIARGEHGQVTIDAGDTVLMSSRRIPGNERAIGRMVNNLFRRGAEVIDDRAAVIHASGHAFNDEQRELIHWCRPRFFVPIHGEYRHLVRHAELAAASGVERDQIAIVEDGTPVELCAGARLRLRVGETIGAGHVFVDGKGVGDVGEVVLRDRRAMAETGMVLCVVIRAGDGSLVAGPELTTRGLLGAENHRALLERATDEVRTVLAQPAWANDDAAAGEQIRLVLRRLFRRELDRRPLVVPVLLTV